MAFQTNLKNDYTKNLLKLRNYLKFTLSSDEFNLRTVFRVKLEHGSTTTTLKNIDILIRLNLFEKTINKTYQTAVKGWKEFVQPLGRIVCGLVCIAQPL